MVSTSESGYPVVTKMDPWRAEVLEAKLTVAEAHVTYSCCPFLKSDYPSISVAGVKKQPRHPSWQTEGPQLTTEDGISSHGLGEQISPKGAQLPKT